MATLTLDTLQTSLLDGGEAVPRPPPRSRSGAPSAAPAPARGPLEARPSAAAGGADARRAREPHLDVAPRVARRGVPAVRRRGRAASTDRGRTPSAARAARAAPRSAEGRRGRAPGRRARLRRAGPLRGLPFRLVARRARRPRLLAPRTAVAHPCPARLQLDEGGWAHRRCVRAASRAARLPRRLALPPHPARRSTALRHSAAGAARRSAELLADRPAGPLISWCGRPCRSYLMGMSPTPLYGGVARGLTLGGQARRSRRFALRGKSGHHRAGWSGNRPGKPAGKCHRNTPPMARPQLRRAQARVKGCGKSAPASR